MIIMLTLGMDNLFRPHEGFGMAKSSMR